MHDPVVPYIFIQASTHFTKYFHCSECMQTSFVHYSSTKNYNVWFFIPPNNLNQCLLLPLPPSTSWCCTVSVRHCSLKHCTCVNDFTVFWTTIPLISSSHTYTADGNSVWKVCTVCKKQGMLVLQPNLSSQWMFPRQLIRRLQKKRSKTFLTSSKHQKQLDGRGMGGLLAISGKIGCIVICLTPGYVSTERKVTYIVPLNSQPP